MTFRLTSLVIVATPGTGALFTIAAGMSRGTRASLIAAVGCTLGTVPGLAAAITGTAALLRASGLAFEAVNFLGVAYLLYMAWSTWWDKSVLRVEPDTEPRSPAKVIRSAVLINLLNRKLTASSSPSCRVRPEQQPARAHPTARPQRRLHAHDVRGVRGLRGVRRRGPHPPDRAPADRRLATPSVRHLLRRLGLEAGDYWSRPTTACGAAAGAWAST